MTCENCIHFDICNENADGNIVELMKEPCFRFFDLVRCKDCRFKQVCINIGQYPGRNGFCSRGKRKTDE